MPRIFDNVRGVAHITDDMTRDEPTSRCGLHLERHKDYREMNMDHGQRMCKRCGNFALEFSAAVLEIRRAEKERKLEHAASVERSHIAWEENKAVRKTYGHDGDIQVEVRIKSK